MNAYTITIEPDATSGWMVYIQTPDGYWLDRYGDDHKYYSSYEREQKPRRGCFWALWHWTAQIKAKKVVKKRIASDKHKTKQAQKQAAKVAGSFIMEVPE